MAEGKRHPSKVSDSSPIGGLVFHRVSGATSGSVTVTVDREGTSIVEKGATSRFRGRIVKPGEHLLHSEVTHVILGAFYDVYNHLGPGFLEAVYEAALAIDLLAAGVDLARQAEVPVHFKGCLIGKYVADLVVERKVIVELKAVRALNSAHEAQVINLLKATGIEVGLVLNFGPQPEFRRLVYSRTRNDLAADAADTH